MLDPYPPSDFDAWAATYDQDVTGDTFPFIGYSQALAAVVRLADTGPGMSILDAGAGTGNLSRRFLDLGCHVTATDFSSAMLKKARLRLPGTAFVQTDLRHPFPHELLERKFDRIVSSYVFHHFELPEKLSILLRLSGLLAPAAFLVIADVSFPNRPAQDAMIQSAGDAWEQEDYWIASEALPLLERAGFTVQYHQVSACAGVYYLNRRSFPASTRSPA